MFSEILSVLFNIIIFEECMFQWSISRPMLSLIVINPQYFNTLKTKLCQVVAMCYRSLFLVLCFGVLTPRARHTVDDDAGARHEDAGSTEGAHVRDRDQFEWQESRQVHATTVDLPSHRQDVSLDVIWEMNSSRRSARTSSVNFLRFFLFLLSFSRASRARVMSTLQPRSSLHKAKFCRVTSCGALTHKRARRPA